MRSNVLVVQEVLERENGAKIFMSFQLQFKRTMFSKAKAFGSRKNEN